MWKLNRKSLIFLLPILLVISGCGKDIERTILEVPSRNGKVKAVYSQILYGGAAGGVGECISLVFTETNEADTCSVLGMRFKGIKMNWNNNVLYIYYEKAVITGFSNMKTFRDSNGTNWNYEIRIISTSKEESSIQETVIY